MKGRLLRVVSSSEMALFSSARLKKRKRSAIDTLAPLKAACYAISRWKTAKVNIDYHVEFEGHYYSVPHRLVGAKIDVRVTGNLLECFASNQRVAGHAVSAVQGGFTTTPEHKIGRAHV